MDNQFYNTDYQHEKLTTDVDAVHIKSDCQGIRIANTSSSKYVDIYFSPDKKGTPYRLVAGEVLPPLVVFPFQKIQTVFSAGFEGGSGEISIIREFNVAS